MSDTTFAAKLQLVLKALSVSRTRLAADLGIDKSLVGRWVSGAVRPSAYNLERLTAHIAQTRPGFTLLDWDRDLDTLASRLGVEQPGAAPAGAPALPPDFGRWLPDATLEEVAVTTEQRGHHYEGFYRTTRPAAEFPGRFYHDQVMVRRGPNGMLLERIGLAGFAFDGWLMPLRNQLFGMATHPASGMLVFSIINGVTRVKAEVLDGLTMSCLPDAGGSPVASAIILERVGDLNGDDTDDQRFRAMLKEPPLAPEGSVPRAIQDHLYRDSGPAAAALGGDAVLKMAYGRSLSRGPNFGPTTPPAASERPKGQGSVIRADFGRQSV